MKLNEAAFRIIKPVNSIDDYVSGHENEEVRESKRLAGLRFLANILNSIDGSELSIPQIQIGRASCRERV